MVLSYLQDVATELLNSQQSYLLAQDLHKTASIDTVSCCEEEFTTPCPSLMIYTKLTVLTWKDLQSQVHPSLRTYRPLMVVTGKRDFFSHIATVQ